MRNFEEMTWDSKVNKRLGENPREIALPYLEKGFTVCEVCQLQGEYTSAGTLPFIPPSVVRDAGVSPEDMYPYVVALCHVCGLLHYSTFGYKNKSQALRHLMNVQGFRYSEARAQIASRLQILESTAFGERREKAYEALDRLRAYSTEYTLTLDDQIDVHLQGRLVYLKQARKNRYSTLLKVYNPATLDNDI